MSTAPSAGPVGSGRLVEPSVTHTPRPALHPSARRGGFTMVELLVVVAIAVVMLGIVAASFTEWRDRSSARRGAQVFARDLKLARSASARGREKVVIRFYETNRWYSVTAASGRELVRRRFGGQGDVYLSSIDLQVPGDSLVFGVRGVADLSGISTSLGEARFASGEVTYQVAFNSLGASRVGEL